MAAGDGVRFTDILTNASTIASLKGEDLVTFAHVVDAIDVLAGDRSMEEFGPGVSPLVRPGRHEVPVDPAVREFAAEWFAWLGGDVLAEVEGETLERLREEARARANGGEQP